MGHALTSLSPRHRKTCITRWYRPRRHPGVLPWSGPVRFGEVIRGRAPTQRPDQGTAGSSVRI